MGFGDMHPDNPGGILCLKSSSSPIFPLFFLIMGKKVDDYYLPSLRIFCSISPNVCF